MQQLTNGTLLQGGKYKIERVLGQGGFGITYLAEQVMLGRKVAVKEFFMKELCERNDATSFVTLGTESGRDTVNRFRDKFLKEARNIARLNHPHIVRIIDVFEENGTAYYVMEYAENGSLADKVKKEGVLSEPIATQYILQVADALDYVHQRKMNHLDVKPANIMINDNGDAVLIDFGLSKQYDAVTGNQTSTTPVGISEGYAPMEQYKQGGVGEFSPETDIYALGATFYKLLTGVTPPSASDVMEDGLSADILKSKGVSDNTIAVICKAMESRKKDRMKNVKDFISKLSEQTFLQNNANTSKEETNITEAEKRKKEVNKSDTDDATVSIDSEETTYIKKQKGNTEENKPFKQSEKTTIKNDNKNNRRKSVLIYIVPILLVLLGGTIYYVYKNVILQEHYKDAIASNDMNALKELLENPAVSQEEKDSINYKIQAFNVNTTPPINEPQEFEYKGVVIKMIPVEGGHFNMGATTEMNSRNKDELPVHDVLLNGFAISETEITEAMYNVVEGFYVNGSRKNIPITNITLEGCKSFCKNLSKITGKKFRLPTIAEWEYAARGGQLSKHYKYSGGDDINEVAWHKGNSNGRIHEVGTRKPNELGLYDMTGNAVEWCYDHYVPGYKTENQVNPMNKLSSENPPRECRGGSYLSDFSKCHISYRFHVPQWAWVTDYLGFRVVMVE